MFRHPDVAHGGIGAQTLAGRSGAAPHGRGRHRSRSGCRDGTAKSRRARRPRWGPLGEDHAARPGIVRLEPVRGEEPVQAFQRIRALHHQPEDQRQIPPPTHTFTVQHLQICFVGNLFGLLANARKVLRRLVPTFTRANSQVWIKTAINDDPKTVEYLNLARNGSSIWK